MDEVSVYLERFKHGKGIANSELWSEMDRVWDDLKLDNSQSLASQDIGSFYSHPVWILNGLFSEADNVSSGHRKAVAEFVSTWFKPEYSYTVADFGGGSGVLGRIFESQCLTLSQFDIIEPWPFDFFLKRNAEYKKIRYIPEFISDNYYDVVIAQDVLEHVNNPIRVAVDCFKAVKKDGLVIFANCFYPHIKCHLPENFYLRHTFKYVICSESVSYVGTIPGAPHMEVFMKNGEVELNNEMRFRDKMSRIAGPAMIRFNPFTVARKILGRK